LKKYVSNIRIEIKNECCIDWYISRWFFDTPRQLSFSSSTRAYNPPYVFYCLFPLLPVTHHLLSPRDFNACHFPRGRLVCCSVLSHILLQTGRRVATLATRTCINLASCVLAHTFGLHIIANPTFYLAAGTSYGGRQVKTPIAGAHRGAIVMIIGRIRRTFTSEIDLHTAIRSSSNCKRLLSKISPRDTSSRNRDSSCPYSCPRRIQLHAGCQKKLHALLAVTSTRTRGWNKTPCAARCDKYSYSRMEQNRFRFELEVTWRPSAGSAQQPLIQLQITVWRWEVAQGSKTSSTLWFLVRTKFNLMELCYTHTQDAPASCKIIAWCTRKTYASTTTSTPDRINYITCRAALALLQLCCAPRLLILRPHWLYFEYVAHRRDIVSRPCRLYNNYVVRRDYSSHDHGGSTSTMSRVRVPRHVARLTRLVAPLFVDYFAYAARPGASSRCAARHAARRRLLRLRRTSGCFGTSRGLSRASLSTTSPTPRVRVPRHVARLVTRLVVDHFDYAARSGSPARRAAHHATRRVTHRRLLRLPQSRRRLLRLAQARRRLASRRLVVDYFASRRLVVDYFAYAARPGASTRRAAHHATCRAARRGLLRLRRASGCLGTSHGSSRHSSLATSPMPRVRVPRHVAWLISPLVVDYFASAARPGASARRAACRATRRRLLRALWLPLAATLALLQPRRASRLLVSRQHRLYFEYAARCHDVVFRLHRVDHSSRLVFQTSRERQSRPQQLVGINSD
jgi:hypothetical protein